MRTGVPYRSQTIPNRRLLRQQAVERYQAGTATVAQIVAEYRVSKVSVYNWIHAHVQDREHGLDSHFQDKVSKIKRSQFGRLHALLASSPRDHGIDADLWNCTRLLPVINGEFGTDYETVEGIRKLLHRAGFSFKKGSPTYRERSPEKVKEWEENVWKPAKKKP